VPPLAGWIDFDPARSSPQNLAILQAFIPSEGDAWSFTLAGLARFLGTARKSPEPARLPRRPLVELAGEQEPDQVAVKHFGDYLAAAGLLGRRVAELHLALLKGTDDPEFMPEPWSAQERRAAHASMLDLLSTVFDLLTNRLASLPDDLRAQAEAVLAGRPRVAARFDEFFKRQPQMLRMRCHGDLHLGQVLYTGKDFVIIDFEGEPARPLSERRCKRTALHDVAGMLRSFHYAAIAAVLEQRRGSLPDHAEAAATTRWASFWQTWSSWAFLRAYLQTMGATPSLPTSRADLRVALDALLIEKAVYEVGYELNNRPEWLGVPLQGISQILDVGSTAA